MEKYFISLFFMPASHVCIVCGKTCLFAKASRKSAATVLLSSTQYLKLVLAVNHKNRCRVLYVKEKVPIFPVVYGLVFNRAVAI